MTAQSADVIPGHYLSTAGDSLSGEFYIGNLKDNLLKFKAPGWTTWKSLLPADVLLVRGARNLYITTKQVVYKGDTSMIFAKRVLQGGYSLFEGSREKQVSLFFINSIERPNLLQVNRTGIATQFQVYFGDCAQKKSKKVRYSLESMQRFIQQMNKCAYPQTVSVKPRVSSIQPNFGIGVTAGYLMQSPPKLERMVPVYKTGSRPLWGVSGMFNVSRTIGFTIGCNLVTRPLTHDSINTNAYVSFTRTNPQTGHVSSVSVTYLYRSALSLNLRYLEIPLNFRLRPRPFAKSGPVISAGFTYVKPLKSEVLEAWTKPYAFSTFFQLNPAPSVEDGLVVEERIDIKTAGLGVQAGLGWRFELGKHSELELMASYVRTREEISSKFITARGFRLGAQDDIIWHRVQLTANYYFLLKPWKKKQAIN
jgi:hypothetical protein